MSQGNERLDRARQYLAIAESGDAKREAYKAAAEEIAAYMEETGVGSTGVATPVGKPEREIRRLMEWRRSGYKAQTPFLMDEQATGRAAVSHTRKVLREQPQSVAKDIAAALEDPDVAHAVVEAASSKGRQVLDNASHTVEYVEGKRRPQTDRDLVGDPSQAPASDSLGGVGPGALSQRLHDASMEPGINGVHKALRSLKGRVDRHGPRLALTDVEEFDELDAQVQEISELYAFMLDSIDAAKRAKVANEAQGMKR